MKIQENIRLSSFQSYQFLSNSLIDSNDEWFMRKLLEHENTRLFIRKILRKFSRSLKRSRIGEFPSSFFKHNERVSKSHTTTRLHYIGTFKSTSYKIHESEAWRREKGLQNSENIKHGICNHLFTSSLLSLVDFPVCTQSRKRFH